MNNHKKVSLVLKPPENSIHERWSIVQMAVDYWDSIASQDVRELHAIGQFALMEM